VTMYFRQTQNEYIPCHIRSATSFQLLFLIRICKYKYIIARVHNYYVLLFMKTKFFCYKCAKGYVSYGCYLWYRKSNVCHSNILINTAFFFVNTENHYTLIDLSVYGATSNICRIWVSKNSANWVYNIASLSLYL